MLTLLAWLILGLIAGALAKLIMPGKQGGGIIVTMVLGIVGALLGGWLGGFLPFLTTETGGLGIGSIFTSVIGALIVLWIYGLVVKKKA